MKELVFVVQVFKHDIKGKPTYWTEQEVFTPRAAMAMMENLVKYAQRQGISGTAFVRGGGEYLCRHDFGFVSNSMWTPEGV